MDTAGVDVTYTAWQSEDALLYAGHRSFTSILCLKTGAGPVEVLWSDDLLTFGDARYPLAAAGRAPGEAAILVEGHFRRPEVVLVKGPQHRRVLAIGDAEFVNRCEAMGQARPHRWSAPDGREIHGWLIKPETPGPHPLIMDVHGGPVWQWRPRFVGRPGYWPALLAAGFAIFHPNVRGSSGRGQDYARQVFGDMGGADTFDYLSGIDSLVEGGIADPARLGVTGGSYGGFMSSWLVTQDQRFAAAAPLMPVTHWASEHLTSHIGHFCEMFLGDSLFNADGKYFSRSPIMFSDRVTTPCMNICGALDQNTPPGQALEFHRALKMHRAESVLLTYPGEGHGVRKMPGSIDFAARLVSWFDTWMPPKPR